MRIDVTYDDDKDEYEISWDGDTGNQLVTFRVCAGDVAHWRAAFAGVQEHIGAPGPFRLSIRETWPNADP